MLPVVGVAMEVFDRPNDNGVIFYCVINAVWKTVYEAATDIILDHMADRWPLENDINASFDSSTKASPSPDTCWL